MQPSNTHIEEEDATALNKLFEADYSAVLHGAGMRRSDAGVLSLIGSDAIDFLNRLSTNDLIGLSIGQQKTTVLTTEKGRVVDLATVACRKNDVLLIVSPSNAPSVKQWLEKFIIMEDIIIEDISTEHAAIEFFGNRAAAIVGMIAGIDQVPGIDELKHVMVNGEEVLIFQEALWHGFKYDFMGSRESINSKYDELVHQTQGDTPPIMTPELTDLFRIERGIPAYAIEITAGVNPLESGLAEFISFTKGCYIGQEVIARLDTYNKLQRKLTGLIVEGDRQDSITLPLKIFYEGNEVGTLTSFTWSVSLQKNIGLGYLRTAVKAESVEIISPDGKSIPARISAVPFFSLSNESAS